MQLDKTLVAIRERDTLGVFDVSLPMIATLGRPLFIVFMIGAVPFAVWNYFTLVGPINAWLQANDLFFNVEIDDEFPSRTPVHWYFLCAGFSYLQAQMAFPIATRYLGSAMFESNPRIVDSARDVWRVTTSLIWSLGFVRLGIVTLAAPFILIAGTQNESAMTLICVLVVALVGYTALLRAIRPYLLEIVVLEMNPIFAKSPTTLTIGRRSYNLHSPNAGDLLGRWIVAVFVIGILFIVALVTYDAGTRLLFGRQDWLSWMFDYVIFPWIVWTLLAFRAVVRFLGYLDLRIRSEGWEVELLLRAEAARLGGFA